MSTDITPRPTLRIQPAPDGFSYLITLIGPYYRGSRARRWFQIAIHVRDAGVRWILRKRVEYLYREWYR